MLVIGEPVIVNSLAPASATATEVTVPPDDGKICVKVIVAEPIVPLSVVQSHNVSALVVPSLIIVNCQANSATVSKSGSLEAVPLATTT